MRPYGLDRAKANTGPVPEINVEEYLRLMSWVRWHTARARVNRERGHWGEFCNQERWAKGRRRQAQRLRAPSP